MQMMKLKSLFSCALVGWALTVSGCAVEAGDAPIGETVSALSVSNWNLNARGFADTWHGVQVGTLNGDTYSVSVGDCGRWDCFPYQETDHLHVEALLASGSLVGLPDAPGQRSNSRVSLAPFNGYLYMVHSGTDGATTWISRYSPGTGWSPNYQIPYTSFAGSPAIVAYNNLLYFIGTGPYPYPMWYATMTAGESFSAPVAIPGHDSASRPSAAVLFGKLYFAHRWGSTGDLVYGVYDGTTWSAAAHIPGGDAGGTLRGLEPVIAADNGVLHLVHTRPEGTPLVWWTYFNGCNWVASEVSLGTLTSNQGPSLTQGGPGLVLVTELDGGNANYTEAYTFAHPYSPYPPIFPRCNIGVIL
jgi:hypothetical protein